MKALLTAQILSLCLFANVSFSQEIEISADIDFSEHFLQETNWINTTDGLFLHINGLVPGNLFLLDDNFNMRLINSQGDSILYLPYATELEGTLYCSASYSLPGDEFSQPLGLIKYTGDKFELVRKLSFPNSFRESGGKLFFLSSEIEPFTSTGAELWVTNGTPEGTYMIKDIYSGADSSQPNGILNFEIVEFKGRFFFPATTTAEGRELWITDLTEQNTSLYTDIVAGSGSSNPRLLKVIGDELYFVGTTPNGESGLYKTDGSETSTILITTVQAPLSIVMLEEIEGTIYFLTESLNPETLQPTYEVFGIKEEDSEPSFHTSLGWHLYPNVVPFVKFGSKILMVRRTGSLFDYIVLDHEGNEKNVLSLNAHDLREYFIQDDVLYFWAREYLYSVNTSSNAAIELAEINEVNGAVTKSVAVSDDLYFALTYNNNHSFWVLPTFHYSQASVFDNSLPILEAAEISFEKELGSDETVEKVITIKNSGNRHLLPANLVEAELSGNNPEDFDIEYVANDFPALKDQQAGHIVISFNPQSEGIKSADLTLSINDSQGSTYHLQLAGLASLNELLTTDDPMVDLLVFPNPTHGRLTIESPIANSGMSYTLVTLEGNIISDGTVGSNQSSIDLDLQQLMSGIYLLKVTQGSDMVIKKIIKTK